MREVFSIRGDFTAESNKALGTMLREFMSYPPARQNQIFADFGKTAEYGSLDYNKKLANALNAFYKDPEFNHGLVADLLGPVQHAEATQYRKHPIFATGGRFTDASKQELLETVRDFASFSKAKQDQIKEDVDKTALHADLEYVNAMRDGFVNVFKELNAQKKNISSATVLAESLDKTLDNRYGQQARMQESMHTVATSIASLVNNRCNNVAPLVVKQR